MTQSMIFYEHVLIHFEPITLWSKLGRKRERERNRDEESYTITSSSKYSLVYLVTDSRELGLGFERVSEREEVVECEISFPFIKLLLYVFPSSSEQF